MGDAPLRNIRLPHAIESSAVGSAPVGSVRPRRQQHQRRLTAEHPAAPRDRKLRSQLPAPVDATAAGALSARHTTRTNHHQHPRDAGKAGPHGDRPFQHYLSAPTSVRRNQPQR